MDVSEQQIKEDEKELQWQTPTIAPVASEQETPVEVALAIEETMERESAARSARSNRQFAPGDHADAELTTMLKQIEAYFTRKTLGHDLEAISFSLRHLFSRVDFLYRQALPNLEQWTTHVSTEENRETFLNQQIWLHVQAVNRTLDRMAPLCHLLSDVIECLLDTLDNEENWLRTFEEEETVALRQIQGSPKRADATPFPRLSRIVTGPDLGESEDWERSAAILMDRLLAWQEQYHKMPSFVAQFAHYALATSSLNELDIAFTVLLDSASAIFGDILPSFRRVQPEDKEEIGALLFDLMQQSDQMLVQFEVTLEPLTSLLRHFAALSESS